MDPSRSDRILQDWDAVASQARRPVAPPRAVVVRSGLSGTSLAGALVLVAVLLFAVVWFGRPVSDDETGGILPPPSATPGRPRAADPAVERRSHGPADASSDAVSDTFTGSLRDASHHVVRAGGPRRPDHAVGGCRGQPDRPRRADERRIAGLHAPDDDEVAARRWPGFRAHRWRGTGVICPDELRPGGGGDDPRLDQQLLRTRTGGSGERRLRGPGRQDRRDARLTDGLDAASVQWRS